MSGGAIDYGGAAVPVRADLPAAHGRAWQRLAAPGTWWTAEERVAIGREVRRASACTLCQLRKAALSSASMGSEHVPAPPLAAPAVEAVHRLTTDPGRLSRRWHEGLREEGLDDGAYVELIGVVVTVVSIDAFCRALGVPLHALPVPLYLARPRTTGRHERATRRPSSRNTGTTRREL